MTKLSVIYFIIKQRVPNIVLLSIMFSSLIVIFMVSLGIKNVFYDYLRSDYGNIPDLKIILNDLSNEKTDAIIRQIKGKFKDKDIDFLKGYETIEKVSILDSEDLLLTNGLPLFIKGMRFDKKVLVSIDSKRLYLDIIDISYQDELFIKFDLKDIKINDKESIKVIADNTELDYGFCKEINIEDNILSIYAKTCEDEIDNLLKNLSTKQDEKIKVELDGKVFDTKVIFSDPYYKSLIVDANNIKKAQKVSLAYGKMEIDNSKVETFEIMDNELIINFKTVENVNKSYKIFLSKILRDFINYHRMILKLNLYAFEDDDKDDKQDAHLVYLNELTDLIDIIFAKNMGNLAISSTFLAQDLNNFGILDNFNIKTKKGEFNVNIRSTLEYNPEKHYDKNILILNNKVLEENFNIKDTNNYIDIYSGICSDNDNIEIIKSIVDKYDKHYSILSQEDIIPSIKAKKILFDSSVIAMTIFILGILFIAMYIVLIQFYSNFNSELSLLKLYGSKIPYQTFVNLAAFVISIGLNYIFMIKEEEIINQIMLKYFFIGYEINIVDFFVSLSILLVYVVLIYFLELQQIKKLNLIKGQ